jgi:hypothetical protein
MRVKRGGWPVKFLEVITAVQRGSVQKVNSINQDHRWKKNKAECDACFWGLKMDTHYTSTSAGVTIFREMLQAVMVR